jgi:NAD(P)-dependent dehydrogenase (short-subunit alcohol dehydrogenase family)
LTVLIGIGYAVVEAVIEHGGSAVIVSSNPKRIEQALDTVQKSYPSTVGTNRISGFPCDLANEETVEQDIVKIFEQSGGSFNHIVYTAGEQNPAMSIATTTIKDIKDATKVRYIAAVIMAKHAPKYMTKGPDSSITLTTSISGQKPLPGWSPISGARTAVNGLGMSLAYDLKPIRVNVIAVGLVDTGLWGIHAAHKDTIFEMFKSKKSTTGRVPLPEDVAEAYIYCMKDKNVTGSIISTNGGTLLV